jgi:hypothetical protein
MSNSTTHCEAVCVAAAAVVLAVALAMTVGAHSLAALLPVEGVA